MTSFLLHLTDFVCCRGVYLYNNTRITILLNDDCELSWKMFTNQTSQIWPLILRILENTSQRMSARKDYLNISSSWCKFLLQIRLLADTNPGEVRQLVVKHLHFGIFYVFSGSNSLQKRENKMLIEECHNS